MNPWSFINTPFLKTCSLALIVILGPKMEFSPIITFPPPFITAPFVIIVPLPIFIVPSLAETKRQSDSIFTLSSKIIFPFSLFLKSIVPRTSTEPISILLDKPFILSLGKE